jgi:hypothetical protein
LDVVTQLSALLAVAIDGVGVFCRRAGDVIGHGLLLPPLGLAGSS